MVYRQKAPKETPNPVETPQSEIVDGLAKVLEPKKQEEVKP